MHDLHHKPSPLPSSKSASCPPHAVFHLQSPSSPSWRSSRSVSSIISVFSLLSLFVFFAVFLSDDSRVPYYTQFKRTNHTPLLHPRGSPNTPPDDPNAAQCTLITPPDTYPVPYRFNTRAFCKLPALCINPNKPSPESVPNDIYLTSPTLRPQCLFRQPSLRPFSSQHFVKCSFVLHHVLCAHGIYNHNAGQPVCPSAKPLSEMPAPLRASARWLDGVAVIVPAYKFMGNIYHYAFASLTTFHIASSLPTLFSSDPSVFPKKVTLLFRGELPGSLGVWQKGLVDLLVQHRLQKLGLQVQVESLHENTDTPPGPVTCVKNAVLLGRRFAVAIWPFPNVTAVHPDKPVVPIESVALRRAAYDAVGISSRLPFVPAGALSSPPPPKNTIIDFPPRALGYSRRNSFPDPDLTNGEFITGNPRRFSDADEEWFVQMLKEETQRMNFSYHVLQTESDMPMSDQIHLYARVGVIVGIHGANFMNTVFSRPFSAVLEVTRVDSICYKAGANAGLYYARYSPVHEATMAESGCAPNHRKCATDLRARRVMIEEMEDRSELRRMVRQQMERVDRLHEHFAGLDGLPVVYDEVTSTYAIDWESAPSR